MELSPIAGIRGVGPTSVPKAEREIQPPFALDRSDRMGDDAYNDARQETERGLEEEGSEPAEGTEESAEMPSGSGDANTQVNFFA